MDENVLTEQGSIKDYASTGTRKRVLLNEKNTEPFIVPGSALNIRSPPRTAAEGANRKVS